MPVQFFYCWDCDKRYSRIITNSSKSDSENCPCCHGDKVVMLKINRGLIIGACQNK